jgi:hypothetical protein
VEAVSAVGFSRLLFRLGVGGFRFRWLFLGRLSVSRFDRLGFSGWSFSGLGRFLGAQRSTGDVYQPERETSNEGPSHRAFPRQAVRWVKQFAF